MEAPPRALSRERRDAGQPSGSSLCYCSTGCSFYVGSDLLSCVVNERRLLLPGLQWTGNCSAEYAVLQANARYIDFSYDPYHTEYDVGKVFHLDFAGLLGVFPLVTSLRVRGTLDIDLALSFAASMPSLSLLQLTNNVELRGITASLFAPLRALPLRKLLLLNNAISAIDATAFNHLPGLDGLDLGTNRISDLPSTVFAGVTQIIHLYVNDNLLTKLDASLFAPLTKLELLDLDVNQLTELPSGIFDSSRRLQILAMTDNLFTVLHREVFAALTLLESLELANNRLTALTTGLLDSLTNLQKFTAGLNSITELHPEFFSGCPALSYVSLRDNLLTILPYGVFDSLTRLALLSLSDNQLSEFPGGFFDKMSHLSWLAIGGNNLQTLPAATMAPLVNLTWLSFDRNKLTALDSDVFQSLTNLQSLELNANSIVSFPRGLFDSLTQLTYLSFGENSISSVDLETAAPLIRLQTLNASWNPSLQKCGFDWTSLTFIDVSGTNVNLVPEMCGLDNTIVATRMNSFKKTDAALANFATTCLVKAKVVDLSDNPQLLNLTSVQAVLKQFVLEIPTSALDGRANFMQTHVPVLQMRKSPVECQLVMASSLRIFTESADFPIYAMMPALKYQCQCGVDYYESDVGECLLVPEYWGPARLVGLILGSVLGTLLCVYIARTVAKHHKRMRYNLALHQGLLAESQSEVWWRNGRWTCMKRGYASHFT